MRSGENSTTKKDPTHHLISKHLRNLRSEINMFGQLDYVAWWSEKASKVRVWEDNVNTNYDGSLLHLFLTQTRESALRKMLGGAFKLREKCHYAT